MINQTKSYNNKNLPQNQQLENAETFLMTLEIIAHSAMLFINETAS